MRSMTRTLALVVTLSAAAAGAALACEPDPAAVRDWAFGKSSPVPVSDAPGDRTTERDLPIAFGVAYPVLQRKGWSDLQLCIDGAAVWTSRVHFADTSRRAWVQTSAAMQSPARPRLEFWVSETQLRIYVGGDTEAAPPDFREVRDNVVLRTIRLPLLRDSVVRMTGGARDVAIANVLLPFPRSAVERYAAVRDPGGADDAAPADLVIGLLVDVSGSTRGFTETPVAELIAALRADDRTAGARIVAASFGGKGDVDGKPARGLADPALAIWEVSAAPFGEPGTHDVAAAAAFVAREAGAPVPLMILAGGDVGLERVDVSAFSSVAVAKITPELQTRLERTAGRGSTVFHAFGPGQGAALAETLIAAAPAPVSIETDEQAFDDVANLMRAARMLPVLPTDIEDQAQLAVPPVGAESVEWFALSLWMVVRADLLTYHEE